MRRHLERWLFPLLAVLLLAAAAAAQVVHVGNSSTTAFAGWKRATVDRLPPHEAGEIDGVRYVLGRRIGRNLRAIDLHVRLQPGQTITVDLALAAPWPFVRPGLPADPVALFQDGPWLGSSFLAPVQIEPDGAAWASHWRGRVGRMLWADLWCLWYPGQPWCPGELLLVASNPSVPDMTAVAPSGLILRFGEAGALVPGRGTPDPVVPAGTSLGDGQGKAWPATLLWRGRATPAEQASAAAEAGQHIHAIGCARVWPEGNPTAAVSIAPAAWIAQHRAGALARLHSWDEGPLGVTANSAQTGNQEDQVFVGAETAHGAASLGAETVRYLVALGQVRRPCDHREATGAPIEPAAHPRLVMYAGRAHWHTGVSPDQLGKPRQLVRITQRDDRGVVVAASETHEWNGPDREHWLQNTVAVATRLTGSRVCQHQLDTQARAFLAGETTQAGWATSTFDSARSVGWAGLLVVHLDELLEDRLLANRVVARWHERVRLVYVPQLSTKPGGLWDPRQDARITADLSGYRMGTMLWQQSLGAWGLDYACRRVGPPEGIELARAGALAVIAHGYTQDASGRWIDWDNVGYQGGAVLPASEYVEGRGAHRTGWFTATWFLPGLAVAMRHGDSRARSIWQQHVGAGGPWVPPGVR